ncbi:MAG: DUF1801 domain-containing protein [Bacteroidia bacterium]|nr:DUF1801 domain-containing protein [Bacteroidia bacterium]
MSKNKTIPTELSVDEFLEGIQQPRRKEESKELVILFKELTQEEPVMWGSSIIGFGSYHYKYESGREGDMFIAGFSPRKTSFSFYNLAGAEGYDELLSSLGKYKSGKSCLYVNKLGDIDLNVLREIILRSVESVKKRYG